MTKEYFKIVVDQKSIGKLFEHYGENMAVKAMKIVNKYTNIIVKESKEIIDDYMYRDTGRLINSIKPSINIYAEKITGEVTQVLNMLKLYMKGRNILQKIQRRQKGSLYLLTRLQAFLNGQLEIKS